MTPDEAFKTWWGTVHNWPTNEHYARAIWHAALAYAAGELRKELHRRSFDLGPYEIDNLFALADLLSPPAAP